MSTTKEFANQVLEKLSAFGDTKIRPMMGEYLLYQDGVLIGGIYDNQILLKTTQNNQKYSLLTQLPYASAKRLMYILGIDEEIDRTREIVATTLQDLPKQEIKILPNN